MATKNLFWIIIFGIFLGGIVLIKDDLAHQSKLTLSGNLLTSRNSSELLEEFQAAIHTYGPTKAYTLFKKTYNNVPIAMGHRVAHLFGEALYNEEGIKGLGTCDQSFGFGCYHSFFGVGFSHEGLGAIPVFDKECRERWPQRYLSCQHGIGHGI